MIIPNLEKRFKRILVCGKGIEGRVILYVFGSGLEKRKYLGLFSTVVGFFFSVLPHVSCLFVLVTLLLASNWTTRCTNEFTHTLQTAYWSGLECMLPGRKQRGPLESF